MIQFRVVAIFLFCLCIGSYSYAQSVSYSPYEKFDFRSGDFAVVGMVNGHLYTYRGSTDGFYLDSYDDSMQKTATVILDFFPQKIYQTKFIAYSKQIIVLYQSVEGNKVIQYAALLDETGRLKKGPIQLDEAKTGIFGPTKTYFASAVSEDKKYIVVYSTSRKGGELSFTGKWIDDQLNIVSRSHATYKADNDLAEAEAMVSNDGIVFLPLSTPIGAKNYSDQVWLLSLQGGTNKFTTKELPLSNQYVASLYMNVDNVNKRVYCGGFYSDRKNGPNEGICGKKAGNLQRYGG